MLRSVFLQSFEGISLRHFNDNYAFSVDPFFIFFAVGDPTLSAQESSGNSLDGLERLKNFDIDRVSSSNANWTNGNPDSRAIEPVPNDEVYFPAMYRQEFPCVMGLKFLVADIERSWNYVGTILSVCHSSLGRFGEVDDFFFIDRETEPSLCGTDTEDYFCGTLNADRRDHRGCGFDSTPQTNLT